MGWRIDREISTRTSHGYGRELVAWHASREGDQVLDGNAFEELEKGESFKGDQFTVNQELFGVVSTFKHDLSQYTTRLDISAVPLSIQKKAAALAREIEGSHGYRKRPLETDDNGMDDDGDEEERWSAVPREMHDAHSQSTCDSQSPEPPPAAKVQGTFVHVDGVGLLDESTARAMPWLFHRNPCPQMFYTGAEVNTTAVAAPAMATVVSTQPAIVSTQLQLPPGTEVVIEGLINSPAFNGLHGIVTSFDIESGRYNVRLQGVNQEKTMAKIKIANLRWTMLAGQFVPSYQ